MAERFALCADETNPEPVGSKADAHVTSESVLFKPRLQPTHTVELVCFLNRLSGNIALSLRQSRTQVKGELLA